MVFKSLAYRSRDRKVAADSCPERNLALAIIKQAWSEAVVDIGMTREKSRVHQSLRKQKAIDWICENNTGFPYWCQVADMNHIEIRQRLREILRGQQEVRRAASSPCPP